MQAALQHCVTLTLVRMLLRGWCSAVRKQQREYDVAAAKLRAAARPLRMWPSELLVLALIMWSRITKFNRCMRQTIAPPVYVRYLPEWHQWETKKMQAADTRPFTPQTRSHHRPLITTARHHRSSPPLITTADRHPRDPSHHSPRPTPHPTHSRP